ncbi:enhancer of polycomb-like-domain-containing protein [Cryomyces antarcticus]|nr:hypothetical protein LTR04_006247 [Oleoguttula sp. CCFEE 6159]
MAASRSATAQRFRQRKLSTKQNLQVVRESEVEKATDDDAQRHIPRVETGVEKGEEIEHHLQAVISASAAAAVGGKVAQIYIPTPETVSTKVEYDRLYSKAFSQPATYIRFSSTVEDCTGIPYCMTSEDDVFLKAFNQKKLSVSVRSKDDNPCSEDIFEEVMNFFEETSQSKQPFAAVGDTPVLAYEELENAFDETISLTARPFAREIYEHWSSQRLKHGNRPLQPTLKFETGVETDDADPYVCFRRREVRQARKTRGRDAQVTEKLKKLRKELEDARHLVHLVKQREVINRERLALDRQIFDQRTAVRQVKQKIGKQPDDNDEDLINQKPVLKTKVKADGSQQNRTSSVSLRAPARADGRPPEADLVSLEDKNAEKEQLIQQFIAEKGEQHKKWNAGWSDLTWRPITPPLETSSMPGFKSAVHGHGLPTPPASISSEQSGDNMIIDSEVSADHAIQHSMPVVRFASPPLDASFFERLPCYRRRMGRGGRLLIDRRRAKPRTEAVSELAADRAKYESDEDGDEAPIIYHYDHFADDNIKYRAFLGSSRRPDGGAVPPDQSQNTAVRRSIPSNADVAMAGGGSTAGH